MRVFAENSLLDARISDIAQRAGLSYGAFYHYFESKEDLFREVAATAVARLGALVNNLSLDDSPSAPLAERLRTGIPQFDRAFAVGEDQGVRSLLNDCAV